MENGDDANISVNKLFEEYIAYYTRYELNSPKNDTCAGRSYARASNTLTKNLMNHRIFRQHLNDY